jgi:hypothetical protein
MSFEHSQFSRDLKLALIHYIEGEDLELATIKHHLQNMQNFDLASLSTDEEKIAFWINIYNGLTNHFIIENKLEKSMRELPNFFTELKANIGDFEFSLDDIEHGVLRKNRMRNFKPKPQFSEEDLRKNFAPKIFDHKIHFALNCGGLSCPSIVSYQAELIHEQLNWAEENFSHSEFLIDHALKQITCSSIFVWYRNDFVETYLNDLQLTDYRVIEKEYNWNFRD